MAAADAVRAILAAGAEQEVDGVIIRVQMFERQQAQITRKNDDEQAGKFLARPLERQESLGSGDTTPTASTLASPSDGSAPSEGCTAWEADFGADWESE